MSACLDVCMYVMDACMHAYAHTNALTHTIICICTYTCRLFMDRQMNVSIHKYNVATYKYQYPYHDAPALDDVGVDVLHDA